MNHYDVMKKIENVQQAIGFSGTFAAKRGEEVFAGSDGFANRAEKINNTINTRYGIASGCKIFTSIAICQLVERGLLSFDSQLNDCLNIKFPHFHEGITIDQLLTHTSGIPDYFDEEVMEDFEELWVKKPMYHVRRLSDFLSFFQYESMKSPLSNEFCYNNAGYIVLGLIVEQISGLEFSKYIEEFIFKKAGMKESGYFEMDALPERVALGYIETENGGWKTNIYSVPAKGGSDGGAYTTAQDMILFWDALYTNKLLSDESTQILLSPRIEVDEDLFYGYGGYMETKGETVLKNILMGYDPGVNFRSVYYPATKLAIAVCSNKSDGAYEVIKELEEHLA